MDATLSSDVNMCLIWGANDILPFPFLLFYSFLSLSLSLRMIMNVCVRMCMFIDTFMFKCHSQNSQRRGGVCVMLIVLFLV